MLHVCIDDGKPLKDSHNIFSYRDYAYFKTRNIEYLTLFAHQKLLYLLNW